MSGPLDFAGFHVYAAHEEENSSTNIVGTTRPFVRRNSWDYSLSV